MFAILLWTLGLRHRASSLILSGLKVMVRFMTIWRDVQEARQMKKRNHWKPVCILGLNGANVLGWGQKDAVPVTNVLTDFYCAFPALKGHLIKPHLQRDAATYPAGFGHTWQSFRN